MHIRERAREYLSLGWSVFPIIKHTKKPCHSWNPYREKCMDPEDVDSLFNEGDNIAVACGKLSGIMVIDQDLYKGKPGLEFIDSPLKAITPRGGIHLYFKYQKGTQNTVNENVGTDIRSEGGYVLIPDSTVKHEEGMGTYMWVKPPTKEMLETLPEAPKSLLAAVYDEFVTQTSSTQNSTSPRVDYGSLHGLPEGGRNNAISRAALSVVSKLRDEGLAWQTIQGINAGFTPPLPESELRATFESAIKRYRSSPPVNQNPKKEMVELSSEPPTETKTDISTAINQMLEGKKKGVSTGFMELDALTGGFLPGQSYLLYADTSVGKSMFAVNMLVSLAERGEKVLYFDLENDMTMTMERIMYVKNNGKVNLTDFRIYSEIEVTKEKYINDVFAPVYEMHENFFVWDLNKLTNRFGDIQWEGVKKCIDEGIENGFKIIIVDHLHYFAPGETDHSVLGEIARQINSLASNENVSVLLVAHTKKGLIEEVKNSKTNEVRAKRPTIDYIAGSAMIAKHFKNIIGLQRNSMAKEQHMRERTIVYVDKTKYGAAGDFELVYDEATLVFGVPRADKYVNALKNQAIEEKMEQAKSDPNDVGIVEEEVPVKVKVVKMPGKVYEAPKPFRAPVKSVIAPFDLYPDDSLPF